MEAFMDNITGQPGGFYWESLELIFGGWINAPWGNGDGSYTVITLFLGAFAQLSTVAFAIGVFWGILSGTVATANEGKFGGSIIDPVWWPFRTIIGAALLAPASFSMQGLPKDLPHGVYIPYISVIAVYATGVGSNIADQFTYWAMESIMGRSVDLGSSGNGYVVMNTMLRQSMCMRAMTYSMKELGDEDPIWARGQFERKPFQYLPSSGGYQVLSNTGAGSMIGLGPVGRCGKIGRELSTDENGELLSNIDAPLNALNVKYVNKMYKEIVDPLTSFNGGQSSLHYSELESGLVSGSADKAQKLKSAGVKYIQFAEAYEAEMKAIIAKALSEEVEGKGLKVNMVNGEIRLTTTMEAVKRYGWGLLGAYYTIMSKTLAEASNNIVITGDSVTYTMENSEACSITSNIPWYNFWSDEEADCKYLQHFTNVNLVLESVKNLAGITSNKYASVTTACDDNGCDKRSFKNSLTNVMSSPYLQTYGQFNRPLNLGIQESLFTAFMGKGDDGVNNVGWVGTRDGYGTSMANQEVSASGMQIGNWVMYVSNLGQSIIIGNTVMNFALATAQGAAEFASTSVTSWGGSGALAGVAMYWISFFKVINGIFAMYGIGYAYLIPMAPVLIFGMGYLSVLLLQASGIIISPMVPAVAFRPEGKGMSGQNLGRTLGWTYTLVFQAPALIAGFVLSMFITGIGYVFFNTVFFMIFGQESWVLNPYNLIGMATLHFAGLTILLHTCFKSGIVFKDLFLDFVSGKDYNMGGHIDNISTDRVGQSLMDAGASSKINVGEKTGQMIAQKRLNKSAGGQGKTK